MKSSLVIAVLAACSMVAATAGAEPIFGDDTPPDADRGGDPAAAKQRAEQWRPGFGARVGGYGFRDPEGSSDWDDCRMNGFGLFGTLDANKYFFGELSAEFYNAIPDQVAAGMDRTSTHVLAAAGFRMLPDFVLTPYVQLGFGGEWTRVQTHGGTTEGTYPMGFLGLGAELNVTRELKLGANLRMLATAHPVHGEHGHGATGLEPEAEQAPGMELAIASQGQFFLRYAL